MISSAKINKSIKLLFGILITIFLLIYLFSKVDFSLIVDSIYSLPFSVVLLALVFYSISYIFRALRVKLLLNNTLSFKDTLSIVCIHNFFTQLIPARIGEFSYILLLKKRKVPFSKNISSIGLARLMDFLFVSFIFFIGLVSSPSLFNDFYFISMAIFILAFFVIFLLLIVVFNLKKVLLILKKISGKIKHNFIFLMIDNFKGILSEFTILKSKRNFYLIILYSFFIWTSLYSLTYTILNFFFPNLSFLNILLIGSLPVFISSLPIHGIAGYGTTEIGYLFPLLLFNIEIQNAIAVGFVVHTLQVIFLVVYGFLGFLVFYKSRN